MTNRNLPVRFTGQHFTIDKVLIEDAIFQSNINQQDTVLDIGAGKGFLTVHLLKNAKYVIAIEKDVTLCRFLRRNFARTNRVQIIGCDFRSYQVPKTPFKVVSNIPFAITSEIFKILMFENIENFVGGSVVLQLEAAQKLCAPMTCNPLTMFYQTFYDLKLLYKINPDSFLPPPTVKSALLIIKRKKILMKFEQKFKYLDFLTYFLRKPELSVKDAFQRLFRKKQVRTITELLKINLNNKVTTLNVNQWKGCFIEMLNVVPERFHP